MTLDNFDKKILQLLQNNNKMPQKEIANLVNLSPSAVNRRITTLEEKGYIKANIAVIDNEKIDKAITLIVEVKIVNKYTDLMNAHKETFLSNPAIQQVYYVTGEFDFLLILTVTNMVEYERLSEEIFFENENICAFKTIVTMQKIKQTFNVDI